MKMHGTQDQQRNGNTFGVPDHIDFSTVLNQKKVQSHLVQQLRQYKDMASLFANHYSRIPMERFNDRTYYYFLCHFCATTVENLQARLKNIFNPKKVTTLTVDNISQLEPTPTQKKSC
jgi:hypothetical protein